MTTPAGPTVADLGEDDLIASFVPLLPRGRTTLVPTGDDAAVIAAPDGRFCVSTDVLVEGHHFRLAWGTGADVGWRAAMQNLADIAGMGAEPTSMVVSMVLPPATPVSWLHDFCRGLSEACEPLGVGVDGGDLSAGEQLVVAVTVHGDLAGRDPVLRSGARPGDVVAHSGLLGRAAAGHALLASGRRGGSDEALIRDFLRPRPALAAGPAAARAGATSMMDVSDGLLRDAGRLARRSGVVLTLDPPATSVPDAVAALAGVAARLEIDPTEWVLGGGEDHGMLATFPAGTALPEGFTVLGRVAAVSAEHPAGTVLVGDAVPAVRPGWDHFRS
ncbi:thiamine-phosphate kinase [Georgenia yuyongxinii]|uniref:Thiamine-monophosphate kinase n=1 Tax=Georgenia yuyongxinii TaxID=2589797 RepID=A0A5B8C784_9MICO|nr:thiamine-phosphate kinase [Georgenia yuyongxinii]QDC25291.1 thiamine-phosphate kinase [Georgenia yuyongxinii]